MSVVRVLLKDPRVDVTLADDKGCTPLWWASYAGRHEVIELLIASGRDLGDIRNKKGKYGRSGYFSALGIAKEKSWAEEVPLLERFLANSTDSL